MKEINNIRVRPYVWGSVDGRRWYVDKDKLGGQWGEYVDTLVFPTWREALEKAYELAEKGAAA